jgi:hypothetical protein
MKFLATSEKGMVVGYAKKGGKALKKLVVEEMHFLMSRHTYLRMLTKIPIKSASATFLSATNNKINISLRRV